jgi:hypothetical protein
MPDDRFAAVERLRAAHAGLPRPAHLGLGVGAPRPVPVAQGAGDG